MSGVVLAFDTATPATVVGVAAPGAPVVEARHDPAPGERPQHAQRLLLLVEEALRAAGAGWGDVARLGVGVGPGSFTGLRVGVATAQALALARDLPLVPVPTLEAQRRSLEAALGPAPGRPVLAVLDARRREVFVLGRRAGEPPDADPWLPPAALDPVAVGERLAALGPARAAPLAAGDGAVRYADALAASGAEVPGPGHPAHRVAAPAVCGLAGDGVPAAPRDVTPLYLRLPDAEITRRQRP